MKVLVGVSNRHVHLCQEDIDILFGDIPLEKTRDLVQINEFATNQIVTLKTEKGILEKVRVLGSDPVRGYTQAEISHTDSYKLGVKPPVRSSGQLDGSVVATIIGPKGTITKPCLIVADRHIHINPKLREEMGLTNVKEVSVAFNTEKGVVFKNVHLKETPLGVLELHIDTDDANGAMIKTGDYGEIITD